MLTLHRRMQKYALNERLGLQCHVFVLPIAVVGVGKVYALRVRMQGAILPQGATLDVARQVQGHATPVRVGLAEFNVPVLGVLASDALAPMLRIVLGR